MIPDELASELGSLKDRNFVFSVVEQDSRIYIIFSEYPLPDGIYAIPKTALMIFTTSQYPNAGFDMFWTEETLLLRNGQPPRGAESIEVYVGRRWRRFSYHPYNSKPWKPSEDNLEAFLSYVNQRLRKGD